MYKNGRSKTFKIQKGTDKIIDGIHRYHAAKKVGVDYIYADVLDVPNSDLQALAYQFNAKHGVPYSKAERDNLIKNLYLKDGKTQEQIAKIVGLSGVYCILIGTKAGEHSRLRCTPRKGASR